MFPSSSRRPLSGGFRVSQGNAGYNRHIANLSPEPAPPEELSREQLERLTLEQLRHSSCVYTKTGPYVYHWILPDVPGYPQAASQHQLAQQSHGEQQLSGAPRLPQTTASSFAPAPKDYDPSNVRQAATADEATSSSHAPPMLTPPPQPSGSSNFASAAHEARTKAESVPDPDPSADSFTFAPPLSPCSQTLTAGPTLAPALQTPAAAPMQQAPMQPPTPSEGQALQQAIAPAPESEPAQSLPQAAAPATSPAQTPAPAQAPPLPAQIPVSEAAQAPPIPVSEAAQGPPIPVPEAAQAVRAQAQAHATAACTQGQAPSQGQSSMLATPSPEAQTPRPMEAAASRPVPAQTAPTAVVAPVHGDPREPSSEDAQLSSAPRVGDVRQQQQEQELRQLSMDQELYVNPHQEQEQYQQQQQQSSTRYPAPSTTPRHSQLSTHHTSLPSSTDLQLPSMPGTLRSFTTAPSPYSRHSSITNSPSHLSVPPATPQPPTPGASLTSSVFSAPTHSSRSHVSLHPTAMRGSSSVPHPQASPRASFPPSYAPSVQQPPSPSNPCSSLPSPSALSSGTLSPPSLDLAFRSPSQSQQSSPKRLSPKRLEPGGRPPWPPWDCGPGLRDSRKQAVQDQGHSSSVHSHGPKRKKSNKTMSRSWARSSPRTSISSSARPKPPVDHSFPPGTKLTDVLALQQVQLSQPMLQQLQLSRDRQEQVMQWAKLQDWQQEQWMRQQQHQQQRQQQQYHSPSQYPFLSQHKPMSGYTYEPTDAEERRQKRTLYASRAGLARDMKLQRASARVLKDEHYRLAQEAASLDRSLETFSRGLIGPKVVQSRLKSLQSRLQHLSQSTALIGHDALPQREISLEGDGSSGPSASQTELLLRVLDLVKQLQPEHPHDATPPSSPMSDPKESYPAPPEYLHPAPSGAYAHRPQTAPAPKHGAESRTPYADISRSTDMGPYANISRMGGQQHTSQPHAQAPAPSQGAGAERWSPYADISRSYDMAAQQVPRPQTAPPPSQGAERWSPYADISRSYDMAAQQQGPRPQTALAPSQGAERWSPHADISGSTDMAFQQQGPHPQTAPAPSQGAERWSTYPDVSRSIDIGAQQQFPQPHAQERLIHIGAPRKPSEVPKAAAAAGKGLSRERRAEGGQHVEVEHQRVQHGEMESAQPEDVGKEQPSEDEMEQEERFPASPTPGSKITLNPRDRGEVSVVVPVKYCVMGSQERRKYADWQLSRPPNHGPAHEVYESARRPVPHFEGTPEGTKIRLRMSPSTPYWDKPEFLREAEDWEEDQKQRALALQQPRFRALSEKEANEILDEEAKEEEQALWLAGHRTQQQEREARAAWARKQEFQSEAALRQREHRAAKAARRKQEQQRMQEQGVLDQGMEQQHVQAQGAASNSSTCTNSSKLLLLKQGELTSAATLRQPLLALQLQQLKAPCLLSWRATGLCEIGSWRSRRPTLTCTTANLMT